MITESFNRVRLRIQAPEDERFLFQLYASTRQEELDQAGMPEAAREPFLRQQYAAMTQGYRTRFADASWNVIEFDEHLAGRIIVLETAQETRVVDLALLDPFRGLGIGSSIIRRLQDSAHDQGKPVRLRAFLGSRAEGWYRRLGFTQLEEDGLRVHLEWSRKTGEILP